MLDAEIVTSLAPGASTKIYFAPNTDQGFIDCVNQLVADKVNVISISWGSAESTWTAQTMQTLDQSFDRAGALGITITVAAGDDGSSDGVNDGKNHVDFPASSPHVLACGGTNLQASNGTITSETTWNGGASGGATGGGVSEVFALPDWQAGVPVSASTGFVGRGVPDIAADADPASGHQVRVDGQDFVIGGTSAVAPLTAALVALSNQKNGANAGFINPKIYSSGAKGAFNDITQGNNGTYSAGPGWDACTGLGSPNGENLAAALAAQPSS